MDTKQLLEMLKLDITHWSRDALAEAYNYCVDHMIGMDQRTPVYAWWWNLRDAIIKEIDKRDNRAN